MTQIKPLEGMMTPRFADIATFFRLPVIKDLVVKRDAITRQMQGYNNISHKNDLNEDRFLQHYN